MTKFQYILAALIICGFFGLAVLYIWTPDGLSDFSQKQLGLLTGSIITNFSIVISYCFGSSKGSSDKTAALEKLANRQQQ